MGDHSIEWYGRIGKVTILSHSDLLVRLQWAVRKISTMPDKVGPVYFSPEFKFLDATWYLGIYRVGGEWMGLEVWRSVERFPIPVRLSIGVLQADGKEHLVHRDWKFPDKCRLCSVKEFLPDSFLVECRDQLAPSDVLTVTCVVSRDIPVPEEGIMFLSGNFKGTKAKRTASQGAANERSVTDEQKESIRSKFLSKSWSESATAEPNVSERITGVPSWENGRARLQVHPSHTEFQWNIHYCSREYCCLTSSQFTFGHQRYRLELTIRWHDLLELNLFRVGPAEEGNWRSVEWSAELKRSDEFYFLRYESGKLDLMQDCESLKKVKTLLRVPKRKVGDLLKEPDGNLIVVFFLWVESQTSDVCNDVRAERDRTGLSTSLSESRTDSATVQLRVSEPTDLTSSQNGSFPQQSTVNRCQEQRTIPKFIFESEAPAVNEGHLQKTVEWEVDLPPSETDWICWSPEYTCGEIKYYFNLDPDFLYPDDIYLRFFVNIPREASLPLRFRWRTALDKGHSEGLRWLMSGQRTVTEDFHRQVQQTHIERQELERCLSPDGRLTFFHHLSIDDADTHKTVSTQTENTQFSCSTTQTEEEPGPATKGERGNMDLEKFEELRRKFRLWLQRPQEGDGIRCLGSLNSEANRRTLPSRPPKDDEQPVIFPA